MSVLSNRARPVKPARPKPPRTVRLVEPPLAWLNEGEGQICITVGPVQTYYKFREFVSQLPGRAFHVKKGLTLSPGRGCEEGDEESQYDIRVHTQADSNCGCLGFERWGHCKHVECFGELIQAGKIPVYLSSGDKARNDPAAFTQHEADIHATFTPNPKDRYCEAEYS